MNLKNLETKNIKVKGCIYGISGTRKTTFVGSFPKLFIFDMDHKLDVLLGKDIEYESFNCSDTSGSEFERFKKILADKKKDPSIESICIDGWSTFDQLAIWGIVSLSSNKKENRMPNQDDYRRLSDYYVSLIMGLMSVDKHVIITAHEYTKMVRSVQYGKDGEEIVTEKVGQIIPLITGDKIITKLPGIFKECWRFKCETINEKGEQAYVLRYKPHENGKAVASSTFLNGDGRLVFKGAPSLDQVLK